MLLGFNQKRFHKTAISIFVKLVPNDPLEKVKKSRVQDKIKRNAAKVLKTDVNQ